jgi:predicted enzyme related to lactoylglutathione lyase
MSNQEKINYIEFPAIDIPATKAFFEEVFDWTFTDYGDEYTAFSEERLEGGFYQSDKKSTTENGSALIIFYTDDLEASEKKIRKAGGRIIKPIFSFPGGRRFHFTEPSGNELSVWSDK